MLVNQGWQEGNARWRSKILTRKLSYHNPIVGWNTQIPKPHNIPFRFRKVWISHKSLKDVVEASWNEPLYDVPIRKVVKKLKRLKQKLKSWSFEVFGNHAQHLKQLEEEMVQILKDQEN
ncbi:hypothetical protein IFM89_017690 [Coptis chinensis]|uniref:Uncharacterized protein n=1 Tax=Coptis chinensis TaxID=261450 RepID=A0A835LW05_9MAGN|nr:hypothetical protein IFM89_017690 [Coptis chinensis]